MKIIFEHKDGNVTTCSIEEVLDPSSNPKADRKVFLNAHILIRKDTRLTPSCRVYQFESSTAQTAVFKEVDFCFINPERLI